MTAAEPVEADALPPGTVLSGWRLERVLGQGGFGITYDALALGDGARAALKEYLPVTTALRRGETVIPRPGQETLFAWGLARFTDEARIMARFSHPNIVRYLRWFESHGTACIVMAYEDGRTLAGHLRAAEVPVTEAWLLMLAERLLDGLGRIHAAGYLHRDIKPANIILRRDGSPVLIDFGAARQALRDRAGALTTVVSAGYAPLEQYHQSGQQGPWTDIYGLAAVLYRAVTGSRPIDAVARAMGTPLPALAATPRAGYSPEFLAAIDWGLALQPGDRPRSTVAWQRALVGTQPAPARAAERTAPTGLTPDAHLRRPLPREPVPEPLRRPVRADDPEDPFDFAAARRRAQRSQPDRRQHPPLSGSAWAVVAALSLVAASVLGALAERLMQRELAAEERLTRLVAAAGSGFRDCADCPEMVVLPGGPFRLGAPSGRGDDTPQIEVILPADRAIGRFEVTEAEWQACVLAGDCPPRPLSGDPRRPVTRTSWSDASAYVRWLQQVTGRPYRLPSEAEWEHAARAGAETTPSRAVLRGGVICADCDARPATAGAPVGSRSPNGFGLHDLLGNVREWVADCFRPDAYAVHAARYPDPYPGTDGRCSRRVIRGGGWRDPADLISVTLRTALAPDADQGDLGFRVALTLEDPPVPPPRR